MKTWSGTDLAGFILSLFGIFCAAFSNSPWLTDIVFILASLSFMHSVYKARYENLQYRKMLCHYQAILSVSDDGWVAWNEDNEYIGASKKFKELLQLESLEAIRILDVMDNLQSKSANDLADYLTKLMQNGEEFRFIVETKNYKKLEIRGSRKIISKVESIVLWCIDATEITSEFGNLRKQAAQAVSSMDNVFEMINALPIPVWRRGSDLRIIYCNNAYANALGKSVDEVVSGNIPFVPGSLFGQGHSLAENAKKCSKSQTVIQHVTVNGVRKQFSIHECYSPNGLIGYALDTSSTEKLASQLDKLVTSNCEVLNGISSSIAIYDNNMKLIFFNNAFQCTMKLESGWLHSHPTYGEILDELRNNRRLPEVADFQAFKKDQLALFKSVVEPVQTMMHLPNGKSLRQMIAPYTAGGLVFIIEDVTNSLLLQRKNDTLMAVQKETIDHLYEGIIVCGSDNRVKIMNKSLANIWGIELDEIKEKEMHLSELLDKIEEQLDYDGEWNKFKEYAISNLTDRMAKTGRLTKKNGNVILFSYVPLPDGAHMHSMVDITDTCTVENAIIEKNQALHAAHRLEMEFITGVSTEIKGPLTVLISASDLLLHEYYGPLTDKQRDYCTYALSAANQLHQLVDNALDMVAIDKSPAKLTFDEFSITDAIDEVLMNLRQRIQEKNIEISKNYKDSVPAFFGHKTRMKQVLFNIILNAIQFSPIGGIIEIIIRTTDTNMKILIKDSGMRYVEKQRDTKRKIFTRLDGNDKSTCPMPVNNITMPLVRELIAKHGGKIKVISDVEGTSVMCVFPLHRHTENNIQNTEENTIKMPESDLPKIDNAVNS